MRKAAVMAAFLLVLALGAYLAASYGTNDGNVEPEPPAELADDGFPDVDWDDLLARNPDTIGWVTVPGTTVDYPIVQAHADDPRHYLNWSFDGKRSGTGAVYLDAGCEEGLDSQCCYVFGHNIAYGEPMFRPLASYLDQEFAEGHRTILLQTPEWRKRLKVEAVDEVSGYERTKQTSFETMEDYRSFRQQRIGEAKEMLVPADQLDWDARTYVLVTCVSDTSRNARVLVYCSEE